MQSAVSILGCLLKDEYYIRNGFSYLISYLFTSKEITLQQLELMHEQLR